MNQNTTVQRCRQSLLRNPARRFFQRRLLFPVVSVLVILTGGPLLTWWTVDRADRQMREDLLAQARLVAEAVNSDQIQALTGTEADLASPVYLRLKEQLACAKAAHGRCRFIYIMGRRDDGAVFFFVDNEPVGSEDESPAGQIYEEVSPAIAEVFATRAGLAEGPITDRWGTWVTAAVPLDPANPDDPVRVLGMDVDAGKWQWTLVQASVPPLTFALALSVILLLFSALFARRRRLVGARPQWLCHLEPGLIAAVGLVLTLYATWEAHENESRSHQGAFRELANGKKAAVAEKLRKLRDFELEGLASFCEGSVDVTHAEFLNYAQYLLNDTAIQAWEWIPIVPAAEKARLEAEARAAGLPGFEIWQKDASGQRVPAFGREAYYPVFRIAPVVGNEPAWGYDLGSDFCRRAALEEAARTGLVTGTAPITLVQETGAQKGMLVYRPVFSTDEPPRLRGFALAVLRMGTLLTRSTTLNESLFVSLSLVSPEGAPECLATSWGSDQPPATGLSATRGLFAFGKTFTVTAHAGPAFERSHPARAGRLAALTGMVITAALAIVVGVICRRREGLERLVAERTEALRGSLERGQRQQQAVAVIAASPHLAAGAVSEMAREVTAGAAQAIGVERVGVWLFDGSETRLECIDLYEASLRGHSSGAVLREHEFRDEFAALKEAKYVDADDALTDPRTASYVAGYLKPLKITSMLDAVIRSSGRNLGTLCFEHVDRPHHWEPDEIAFACQLADQVALTLLNRERRRAEADLRRESDRLANVIRGTNVGSWEWNVQTGETIFNERWADIIGYTLDELAPVSIDTWLKLVHPEDLERTETLLKRHFARELDSYDCECRMKHKDGRWIWVHDRGRVVSWTDDGEPLLMFGTHTEISDRKTTERALAESKAAAEDQARRATQALADMERMHAATIGREERIMEMKREVNELLAELGRAHKYQHT